MWSRWIERAAGFLEGDPKIDILYGPQLRDAEPSTTSKSWFFLPFDFEALKKSNFVDLNQIVHRSSDIRFDQALRRLVDWDYVLRLIGSDPTRIVPVDAIACIYSTSAPDRISVANWPPDLWQNIGDVRAGESVSRRAHAPAAAADSSVNFLPAPASVLTPAARDADRSKGIVFFSLPDRCCAISGSLKRGLRSSRG